MSKYRKRYKRKRYSKASYAVKLAKRALYKCKGELKFLDTSSTGGAATPGLADTVIDCCNILQGDGARAREGNVLCIKSILLRMEWQVNASTILTNCRYLLVQDKQPNGASLSIDNVLQTTSAGLNIITPLQFDQGGRYRVLADGRFCMSAQAAGYTGSAINYVVPYKYISKYIKLRKPIAVKYKGTAGTVADLQTNNIALILMSDEGTLYPNVNYHVRLRFLDP